MIRTQLARWKHKLFQKPFIKDKRFPAYWIQQTFKNEAVFLVQIGSNDGKTGDPFYELMQRNPEWKALLVEPIPYFFKKLQVNYPDRSRFTLENVAINEGERLPFYWVDPKAKAALPDLAYWAEQLGSFDKNHIIRELGIEIEPFIVSQELEGLSLPTLLERNNISQIDILHIDAEGYDWTILSQLDLAIFQPKFILFEYHHLSKNDLQFAAQFLESHYQIFDVGIDLLAVHSEIKVRTAMSKQMKTFAL
ncbi:MAG: FkbM family methyltransferase [Bacteroidota bacterium]